MTVGTGDGAKVTRLASDQVAIPGTKVSAYEALYRRRMAWQFKDEPVPHEALERMLATAVWAPNHRMTEPWRFFVLEKGSDARKKAADLAYEFSMQRNNNPDRAEATRRTVQDPPIIVFVYCVPGANEETTKENYAAVCCAAQNISLAGVAEGLAVTWKTGGATKHAGLKGVLGADESWDIATMLSIGAPAEAPQASRTPVSTFVSWLK